MTDNPFNRPGDADSGPRTTPYHAFPLPPKTRGYDPDPDRDHYGRYRLPDPTGKKARVAFSRATTGAKTLEDSTGLNKWKVRQVISGIHSKPELLELFPEFGDFQEQRAALEEIAESAELEAGSFESRELGTAVHAWLEFIDGGHGTLEDVPAVFRAKAEKYLETLAEWGITVPEGMVERIVWNEETGYVGTFDRIYHLADGTPVIGDVKTSKDLKYSYLSISCQLATYATASLMLSEDGTTWEPMPEVDQERAVVLWVPSNQTYAELVPINVEIGKAALDLAAQLHAARSSGTTKQIKLPLSTIPKPGDVPVPMTGDPIMDAILRAATAEELAALYEEHAEHWTTEHTQAGHARLAN